MDGRGVDVLTRVSASVSGVSIDPLVHDRAVVVISITKSRESRSWGIVGGNIRLRCFSSMIIGRCHCSRSTRLAYTTLD